MVALQDEYAATFQRFAEDTIYRPLLFHGDALAVLRALPAESIDCAMTSPPYWQKREYANGGLGLEDDHRDYVRNLARICEELQRVLKREGSFWLNIGDSYENKGLIGIPWRVVFELTDRQGWILRNKSDPDVSIGTCTVRHLSVPHVY